MGFTGGEIAVFKPLLCVSDLVMVRVERFYFMIYVILVRFCFNDSAIEAIKKPRIGEVWNARSILK